MKTWGFLNFCYQEIFWIQPERVITSSDRVLNVSLSLFLWCYLCLSFSLYCVRPACTDLSCVGAGDHGRLSSSCLSACVCVCFGGDVGCDWWLMHLISSVTPVVFVFRWLYIWSCCSLQNRPPAVQGSPHNGQPPPCMNPALMNAPWVREGRRMFDKSRFLSCEVITIFTLFIIHVSHLVCILPPRSTVSHMNVCQSIICKKTHS